MYPWTSMDCPCTYTSEDMPGKVTQEYIVSLDVHGLSMYVHKIRMYTSEDMPGKVI